MSDSPKPSKKKSAADAIRERITPLALSTDTPPPGDGSRLPTVPLNYSISALARTVGSILHPQRIFRFGNTISTVDERGEISVMNAERFTSWVEDHLAFVRVKDETSKSESIGKDLAGKILAADQFRSQLHELKGVSQVRLPVWRGEGEERTVELAPPGFDPATGLFTLDRIPFDEDMSPAEAWETLYTRGLKDFPFDPEGETKRPKTRSFSAQVAAMLGVFCHSLFPEGTPRPMVVFNANQPGSGKSLLMRLALAPVHGAPAENGKPETEAEFEKVLDAAALARKPFLVLDDCKSIHSQALNRFVTSPVHECRRMHSQSMATVAKSCQVFLTGNSLTISEDLDRRAVVIDLFEPGEATARTFKKAITPAWLFSDATRARFLAALWHFVKAWRDAGMPNLPEHAKPSFEDWTGIIGGIVTSFGMANPFAPRQAETGGDEATRALHLVIGLMVGEAPAEIPVTLTTQEILDRADTEGQTEIIVGFGKDPKKSLGWRLKKLRGRHLLDSQRRAFEFGKRDMSAGAKYPITFLSPA